MFSFQTHDHNKGKAIKRKPIRTILAPVRALFEYMDEQQIPYAASQHRVCRENLHSWRGGHSGLTVYTLIEFADALGFDIVAVPRQPAYALPCPVAVDSTHSAGGTGAAAIGQPGLAA